MRIVETNFILGKYWTPIKMVYTAGRIFFLVGFNKAFNKEIKLLSGRQYHGYVGAPMRDFVIKTFGKDTIWSIPENDHHNEFALKFLQGQKPYARYKQPLVELPTDLPFPGRYKHQNEGTAFILTRKQCIVAGEMGVGKTLEEMMARYIVRPDGAWYVAPKSALKAVERDHRKWNMPLIPEFMTYQGLVKRIGELEGKEFIPPQWVTFDESSCVKTPTSQRAQAAKILSDFIRSYWGDNGYVVLMTGTPAPKTPLDWWMQCAIARPGYLSEGHINSFRDRLAILVDRDFGGGIHKAIAGWKDRENICEICGQEQATPCHNKELEAIEDFHEFIVGKNEVKHLYTRMSGLVLVQKKVDCIDLPEKRFEEIDLTPTRKILQIAKTMANTARSAATALNDLRQLSDGFLYEETEKGIECCPVCNGSKERLDFELKPEYEGCTLPEYQTDIQDEFPVDIMPENVWRAKYFTEKMLPCIRCNGKGEVKVYERTTREIDTPKEAALRELIDLHDEVGRFVVYAAFQGSVDRCTRIFNDMGWQTIRWDGRGIHCSVPEIDPLDLFQDAKGEHPKVGFISQPGAGGMGLTLTASPGLCFWSNTFNAVDRLQAADRIHRLSMNVIRGATIYDLFHLPTDRLVYNNIAEKIARQDLTLGVDISMSAIMEELGRDV